MRRTILACAGVLLSVVALRSDSPKEYDDRTEMDSLQGTWRMEKSSTPNVVTYSGRTWTIATPTVLWHGTYRTDTTSRPHCLDRYYADGIYQGRTFKYIYQLDGDVLRIGTIQNGALRPQTFDDPGIRIYTFRRVK